MITTTYLALSTSSDPAVLPRLMRDVRNDWPNNPGDMTLSIYRGNCVWEESFATLARYILKGDTAATEITTDAAEALMAQIDQRAGGAVQTTYLSLCGTSPGYLKGEPGDDPRPWADAPKPAIMLDPRRATDEQIDWAANIMSGRIDPTTPMPPDQLG